MRNIFTCVGGTLSRNLNQLYIKTAVFLPGLTQDYSVWFEYKSTPFYNAQWCYFRFTIRSSIETRLFRCVWLLGLSQGAILLLCIHARSRARSLQSKTFSRPSYSVHQYNGNQPGRAKFEASIVESTELQP